MESPNAGEGFRDLMKDEMEKEMDKLENVIADLEGRLQRSTHAVPTPRNTFVWESYRKFDSLVIDSSEELEAQLSLARANLSRLKEKIQGSKSNLKACSHMHPCKCSQNRAAEVEVMAMTTSERLEIATSNAGKPCQFLLYVSL